MIEQGQGPEPPEEEEKGKDKKRGKRRNFLLSWLEAREGASTQETSDVDTESPRKGFSALWRRVFERNVSLESIKEPEAKKTEEKLDDILEWWPNVNKTEEDATPENEELVSAEEVTKTVSSARAVENETETQFTQLPAARELEEQVRIMRQNEFGLSNPEPATVSTRPEIKEPEVVVDKKEPMAAVTLLGLGAEYLGRKKQGRNQDKRIRNLERKVEVHDGKTKRLETELTRHETNEKNYQSREQKPVPRRNTEVYPEKIIPKVERKDTLKEHTRPAAKTERLAEEVAKRVETFEKQHEAPTVVLKEMVKAAEANAPVERIYERRQEIKDETSPVYNYGSAVPVSAILKKLSGTSQVNTGLYSTVPDNIQPSPVNPNDELYRRAAQRGFWGAVVIVIFMLMVYLFM